MSRIRELGPELDEILTSIQLIESYCEGMDYAEFSSSPKEIDAVVRRLMVIGEAVPG